MGTPDRQHLSFTRASAETFLAKVGVAAGGLLVTVLVARALGPAGRGEYSAAMAVAALGVQLGSLGLSAANTHFAARGHTRVGPLLGNSLTVAFGPIGLVVALAGGLLAIFPGMAPVGGWTLALALVWIPIGTAYLLIHNLLLGLHRVRLFNALDLTRQVLTIVGIGSVVAAEIYTASLYVAIALGGVAVVLLAAMMSVIRDHGARPEISAELLRQHSAYGFKAYLATFFSFVVLRSDLLMIQYLQTESDTGHYSIAVALADGLYLLPVAVGTVLFPSLSSMSDAGDRIRSAIRTARSVGTLTLGAGVLLGIVASPLIAIIFGTDYAPAVTPLLLLIPGIVALGISTVFMNYMAATGYPWFAVYVPGTAAAINIVCNVFLIPVLGIVGAALSSLASYVVMLVANTTYVVMAKIHHDMSRPEIS